MVTQAHIPGNQEKWKICHGHLPSFCSDQSRSMYIGWCGKGRENVYVNLNF